MSALRGTLAVVALAGIAWLPTIIEPVTVHARAIMLIAEVFELPVRPLTWLTEPPQEEHDEVAAAHGTVTMRLFVPAEAQPGERRPAVILALGVAPDDPEIIAGFCRTLARLGYVVLWPQLASLDDSREPVEHPRTFLAGLDTLSRHDAVDPERISIMGISVGASIGLLAAARPEAADRVRAVVFFGGYHDIERYLTSLATGTGLVDGEVVPWEPSPDAVRRARQFLEVRGATSLLPLFEVATRHEAAAVFGAADPAHRQALQAIDPRPVVDKVRGRLFLLHDSRDAYVHYGESIALEQALPAGSGRTLLIVTLFEHVQPAGIAPEAVGEVAKLYGFLYEVLAFV